MLCSRPSSDSGDHSPSKKRRSGGVASPTKTAAAAEEESTPGAAVRVSYQLEASTSETIVDVVARTPKKVDPAAEVAAPRSTRRSKRLAAIRDVNGEPRRGRCPCCRGQDEDGSMRFKWRTKAAVKQLDWKEGCDQEDDNDAGKRIRRFHPLAMKYGTNIDLSR